MKVLKPAHRIPPWLAWPLARLGAMRRRSHVPRITGADLRKFDQPHEPIHRRNVKRTAAALAMLWIGAGGYCWFAERPFVPVPFGSGLLVELALALFPGAWFVSCLHNMALGAVALVFFVGAGPAHRPIPGNPANPYTVVWRRQHRFGLPKALLSLALVAAGVWLHLHHLDALAAIVESLATRSALQAAAHQWVPSAKIFIAVELDAATWGMRNRIVVGAGGIFGWRRNLKVIFHERLISADMSVSIIESFFGLATLTLRYLDDEGIERLFKIPSLGSVTMVQSIEELLKGEFLVARSRVSWEKSQIFPR